MHSIRARTMLLATALASATTASAFDVTRTIEGRAYAVEWDTIIVGSVLLRLAGIAVPESTYASGDLGGSRALDHLRTLVDGRSVSCELTGGTTYGREIGNCLVEETNVAEAMVRYGHARDCPRYSGGVFQTAETAAREAGLDLSSEWVLPWYCTEEQN